MEESGVGESSEQILSGKQQFQPGEALTEWRSSEQVEENESPSTSPSNWDSDDGDPKPSDLYGHHTWRIENFSQIHKRELRSEAFEIGGYKWHILVYPQGCDVCNHISLFLCVANHDKHLPGWSHFAQFTICVVNKDPKKSKYSDTLHRFWKKEHDWGWKKFMELSKVFDGFIVADTLIIKAQVQVIRERADRPFRCLDNDYRGELIRVYLTNVEQICRRFVEERRSKLGKLIEDKARWSSFRAFWLGMDKSSRHHMAQEKTESILKVVVKYFFIEKEVTSTLVMDSLYCGLKALKGAQKGKKSTGKYLETEEIPVPIVRIENDAFVLVDDVLLLFERVALEPLSPKDDKGPQNRTKDGSAGEEFNKDSIERDERRLTELGCRTIEISVLSFIFSKIEVAHQEAVALRKQEELIRECLAEVEQKARRGAAEKEKKSKKKQGKQKRKGKDKAKDEKTSSVVQDKVELDRLTVETKDYMAAEPEMVSEKSDAVEEVSNVSDSLDCDPEILSIDSGGRDASPFNWDTDTSEVHPSTEGSSSRTSQPSAVQNGTEGRSSSVVDDGSSSCSSVSAPVTTSPNKSDSHYQGNHNTPSRRRNHQTRPTFDKPVGANEEPTEPLGGRKTANISSRNKTVSISKIGSSSRDKLNKRGVMNKEEEARTLGSKDHAYEEALGDRASCKSRNPPKSDAVASDNSKQIGRLLPLGNSTENTAPLKPDPEKFVASPKISKKPVGHQIHVESEKPQAHEVPVTADKNSIPPIAVMSRPLNTSLVLGPRPPATVTPLVPRAPVTVTSGHLGPELVASAATTSGVPHSYRNAAMGVHVTGNLSAYPQQSPPSSVVNSAHSSYSQASAPQFSLHHSDVMGSRPSVLYETANHRDMLQNRSVWIENTQKDGLRDLYANHSSLVTHVQNFDVCNNPVQTISRDHHQLTSEFPDCNPLQDEFPHLDIINELLDDEHGMGMVPKLHPGYQSTNDAPHNLNQHYSPSNPLAPSPSSCRFDWARGYRDDLRYGASGRTYDALGDMVPQSSPQHYAGEFLPEQWQVPVYDPNYLRVRNMSNGSYPYQVAEYANRIGMDRNSLFWSPNGHL